MGGNWKGNAERLTISEEYRLCMTYSNGHMSAMCSFEVSAGHVLLRLLLRVHHVAIEWGIRDFTEVAHVVRRLGRIDK